MKKIIITLIFLITLFGAFGLSERSTHASPTTTDTIVFVPKSSVTCPSGRLCMYTLSADGQMYITDVSGVQIRTNTALRFYPKSSAPGTPTAGDVYYNTATGAFQFYVASWGPLPSKSGGLGFDASALAQNLVLASPNGSSGAVAARALVSADLPIIGLTKGGTGQDNSSVSSNYFFAGPSGGSGSASFRAIVAADIPGNTLTNISSGMFSVGASNLTVSATRYLGLPGSTSDSGTHVTIAKAAGSALVVRDLECDVGTAPGGTDTVALTIQTSVDYGATWVDSAQTCTITGIGHGCLDSTDMVSIAEATRLAVKIVSSATSSAADVICTFRVSK